jgi:8-oxo-dGTP diphosphatase
MSILFNPKDPIPYAACVLVVNIENNTVLAVSRKDDKTKFGIIGGKIDPGETAIEAAVREMKEETGYEVSPKDLISVFKSYNQDNGFTTETFLLPFKYFNPIKQDTIDAHETGVVKWVNWQTLFDGPFGNYNKLLYLEIKDKLEELNA